MNRRGAPRRHAESVAIVRRVAIIASVRRPRRRLVVFAFVALVLGGLTTLFVSWVPAVVTSIHWAGEPIPLPTWMFDAFERRASLTSGWDVVEHASWMRTHRRASAPDTGELPSGARREKPPRGSAARAPCRTKAMIVEDEYGWPFRALCARTRSHRPFVDGMGSPYPDQVEVVEAGARSAWFLVDLWASRTKTPALPPNQPFFQRRMPLNAPGTVAPLRPASATSSSRLGPVEWTPVGDSILPLAPLWTGALLDLGAWSLAWAGMLVFVPRALTLVRQWRRRRRGSCIWCGQHRHSEAGATCSECGMDSGAAIRVITPVTWTIALLAVAVIATPVTLLGAHAWMHGRRPSLDMGAPRPGGGRAVEARHTQLALQDSMRTAASMGDGATLLRLFEHAGWSPPRFEAAGVVLEQPPAAFASELAMRAAGAPDPSALSTLIAWIERDAPDRDFMDRRRRMLLYWDRNNAAVAAAGEGRLEQIDLLSRDIGSAEAWSTFFALDGAVARIDEATVERLVAHRCRRGPRTFSIAALSGSPAFCGASSPDRRSPASIRAESRRRSRISSSAAAAARRRASSSSTAPIRAESSAATRSRIW